MCSRLSFTTSQRVETMNTSIGIPPSLPVADDPLADQVRASAALLEAVAADRTLLDSLPPEVRQRLHQAVAKVFQPDPKLRRRQAKVAARERHDAKIEREEALLHMAGIRQLRR